jgi:hypothetical protein
MPLLRVLQLIFFLNRTRCFSTDSFYMRFEVHTVVKMPIVVFWGLTP